VRLRARMREGAIISVVTIEADRLASGKRCPERCGGVNSGPSGPNVLRPAKCWDAELG